MTSTPALTLKQLCFTGPGKEDACVKFHSGLNIIYGASDAGKSFILEAIDFMLGSGEPLRDIPERVGYNRIWLTIEKPDGREFTLNRGAEGGDFNLYEGAHTETPAGIQPTVLKSKHDANKDDNVSTYILNLVGLAKKKIKRKADGSTNSFTLPFLRHLCIVSETDIQKQGSPITTGQFTQATAELSAFKLLLTGVDDSGIVKSVASLPAIQSKEAKLEVIEELIHAYEKRYSELAADVLDGEELNDQLQRLDDSIVLEQVQLSFTEEQYSELSRQRSSLRVTIERSRERHAEIGEMMQRFSLLRQHYQSDIARLDGIKEAGSLVAALAPGQCPLCGSDSSAPHPDVACDANLDVVVIATVAEKAKVEKLLTELVATILRLEAEGQSFSRLIPRTQQELSQLESKIQELAPSVSERRATFQSLVEKRANVRTVSSAAQELEELKTRRSALEDSDPTPATVDTATPTTELSTSVLDSFSQLLEATLKTWHFPKADRVHFDAQKKDFVIAGKPRGSRGKGMRAITHAAFTISLLEYCKRQKHSHLGFVIMDSPLLAYREPDAADEGVAETGLNEEFFSYLSKWTDRQAIIIENVNPPARFTKEAYSTYFSGTPGIGRAGFFPTPDAIEPQEE